MIILELNRPHLQPVYNIVSHLVYSATGADVRDVIIDGKLVMQNRKLLTLDEEKSSKRCRRSKERSCKGFLVEPRSLADILIHDVSLLPLPTPNFIQRLAGDKRGPNPGARKGDPPPQPAKNKRTGCVAMPGLINAHTHAPMALFRGWPTTFL